MNVMLIFRVLTLQADRCKLFVTALSEFLANLPHRNVHTSRQLSL
jgi:hypothetical protein